MLEIILVIFLCRAIGKVMRAKGRKPLVVQILAVVFWFGGEFAAAFGYGIVMAMRGQPVDQFDLTAYLVAIGGAVAGAALAFGIAYAVPPAEPESAFGYAGGGTGSGGPLPRPTSDNPYNPYGDPVNPFADPNKPA